MAVIRQRTQVFNQPVGVVRQASGAQLGETIARVASQFADTAYRVAAEKAQDVGQKTALARSTSDIVTIDPETGAPVAYTAPSGFGRIAARSYQNMIDRRFEESVISEIKSRGASIASDSANADQYKERMAAYIESMHGNAKNEDGEDSYYVRFVRDTGEQYLASTYTTLRNKEIAAARAALLKQQQIEGYRSGIETSQLIAAGASADEVGIRIQADRARYNELFEAGGISFSTWRSNQERLNGLTGLNSSNQLARVYAGLTERQRAEVDLAIQDPSRANVVGERIGVSDLKKHIINAKVGTSTPSLLTALSTIGESADAVVDTEVDELVSQHSANITDTTTAYDIQSMLIGRDDPAALEAKGELLARFVEVQLDQSATDVNKLDALNNELNKAVPNLQTIADIVGGDRGKEVKDALQGMTADDRNALAKSLSDRRAALNSLESDSALAQKNGYINRTLSLEGDSNLIANFEKLEQDILGSNLNDKQSLLNSARAKFADEAMRQSMDYNIQSLDRYQQIVANLDNPSFKTANEEEAKVLALLRRSYQLEPTTTNRFMSDTISRWTDRNKYAVQSTFNSTIEAGWEAGVSQSPDDLKKYDDDMFGDMSLNAITMMEQPSIVKAINYGVVLPTVSRALTSALSSTNEQEVMTAISVFERLSRVEGVTERGRSVQFDKMRDALGQEAYSLYSAASFIARKESIEPILVMADLRSYEGNIDADIKEGLEIPKNGQLSDALAEYPMSPGYRNEILNTMRIMHARGTKITTDVIDGLIEGYTKDMVKDESIYGPYIGDKTAYARRAYLDQRDIIQNRNALADAMVADGKFNDLLKGGTTTDALTRALPSIARIIDSSRATWESFTGGMEGAEAMSDRDRMIRGLEAIGVDLVYKPIVSSFNNGAPAWEVGYVNDFGGFEPIQVNGESWTLRKDLGVSRERSDLLVQNRARLFNALNAQAPEADTAKILLEVFASTPHMTPDLVRKVPEFNQIQDVFDGDSWIEFYEEARRKYEALPE